MRVEQAMAKRVATCRPDDLLEEATRGLVDADTGCVVVVDDGDHARVRGVLTQSDALRAWVGGRGEGAGTRVADALDAPARTCRPDDLLMDALEIMAQARTSRLPVVDRDGCLLGLVTLAEIARAACASRGGVAALSSRQICRTLARCTRG